jgi:exopolyphosphatase/pppGpp-phosphohydrolase
MTLPEATRTHFGELVQFKAPNGFLLAVATAALRDHMSVSEFLRRCAIARLREMGVQIQAVDYSEERVVS